MIDYENGDTFFELGPLKKADEQYSGIDWSQIEFEPIKGVTKLENIYDRERRLQREMDKLVPELKRIIEES